MLLFCTTNFQFVLSERYVFREISSNRTGCSQNYVSPDSIKIPKEKCHAVPIHKA